MRIFACLEMCPAERVGRLRVETNSATNNSRGNFLLIQFEAVHCPANKGSLGKPQRQTNPIHPSTVWIPHYIVIENQVQPGTAGYKNILNHSKAGKEDENGWEWMKWFIQFSWTCSLNIDGNGWKLTSMFIGIGIGWTSMFNEQCSWKLNVHRTLGRLQKKTVKKAPPPVVSFLQKNNFLRVFFRLF